MKNKRSHPRYGVLVLSRPAMRQLQAEWQAVERPSPPMRLTPEADEVPVFFATADQPHIRDAA